MNIIFFGASKLGFKCCRYIIENKLANIISIYTLPESFNISYSSEPVKNVNYADFSYFEKKYSIKVQVVENKITDYLEDIKNLKPDFILVIGWYHKIPLKIRSIPSLGCAGLHASLLPKYRGGAPLVWALINGEKKSGVTFFYFDEEIDSGDIIAQQEFEINDDDNINTLISKAELASINLLKTNLPLIALGEANRIKQNEAEATYFPQRRPEDGEINWDWDTVKIKNFIKAQTKPYPGAYTIINNKKVIIWDADISEL